MRSPKGVNRRRFNQWLAASSIAGASGAVFGKQTGDNKHVAVIGAGLHAVIIAIVIIDWTRFCRVMRAETMVQKERDYVSSATTIGLSRFRILFQEVLPNLLPLLIVLLTLEMGIAIVVETILSFVGLSVASDTPTWGNLIQEGRQYIHQAPWLLGLPVACVVLSVLGLNALGDGIKEVIDPESRQ